MTAGYFEQNIPEIKQASEVTPLRRHQCAAIANVHSEDGAGDNDSKSVESVGSDHEALEV